MSPKLNPAQQEAVEHKDGPLMIIAGAGTGKTRVLTHRIARLIEKGVLPEKILAVTFTNKAAREMRERLQTLLGYPLERFSSRNPSPFIGTFHSLGILILRENAKLLGMPVHFSILDRDDSLSIIKRAAKGLSLDPKRFPPAAILNTISKYKGETVSFEEFRNEYAHDTFTKAVASVWERYASEVHKEKVYDFDDLLSETVSLLKKYPDVLSQYHERWNYLHVDEYQDTNTVQYELIRLLSGAVKNVCIVGDHDQCIYTWRSADIRNLEKFEKEFTGTKVVTLEENYRSTQTILTAANDAIRENTVRKEKNLFTNGRDGEKIEVYMGANEVDESGWIASRAQELIDSGVSAHEIAVLFRANFLSRALEEGFLKARVAYQVLGVRFFERKEVKDVLSYIGAALNPESATHIARIINTPARGIGKVTLLKILSHDTSSIPAKTQEKIAHFRSLLLRIAEYALSHKPSETIAYTIKESGLEHELKGEGDDGAERLANIRELVSLATRYDTLPNEEGIRVFLEEAMLASDQDALKEKEDTVKLMTIHAAKGLEFEHVFVSGLEEGLFPNERSEMRDKPEEREEERRLFYVALTRAKKRLHLSYAMIRTIFGSPTVNTPSRFLTEISEDLVENATPDDSGWGLGGRELLSNW
ncbi:MAG: UvrD-helicase domain-containing protein [Patescibacteria group bacterium]